MKTAWERNARVRKMKEEVKYRELKEGETIEYGDQTFSLKARRWIRVSLYLQGRNATGGIPKRRPCKDVKESFTIEVYRKRYK